MIRLKRFISIGSICLLISGSLYAQNLFDSEHSLSFSNYLLSSRQYSLASLELERIVFMMPDNQEAKINLLYAYRKNGDFDKGIRNLEIWYPDLKTDSLLSEEWLKLLLLGQKPFKADEFLADNASLPASRKLYYSLANSMLSGDWKKTETLSTQVSDYPSEALNQLTTLLAEKEQQKYKKPGLALGLSALVPGLGKAYSKDWKDGLISLLFVATNSWQAYRGFSKDGISSVYGWIFATMAAGFYGSNLYGSWKSANDYNNELYHELHHQIENTVYSRF